ncbi:MAG: helix-turn-helix transcriptional regulator [Clostridia bacterium]|nr:helix-turn-helix transcriptional regulator [Clostridia bacterium]
MKSIYQINQDLDNVIKCFVSTAPYEDEHYHSKIEIYYALTSGVKIMLNNKLYDMRKDSFVIADSFDVHSNYGNGEFMCLIIPDKYFESYKQIRSNRVLKQKYFDDALQVKKVYDILCDISTLSKNPDVNFLQLEGSVKYLLGTILSFTELVEGKTTTVYDTLKEVLIYINANYKENVTLDKISEGLGLNKHYISHLISKTLSQNLNDYINGLRINYFINNIEDTERIGEVAFESGFQSLATFYRAFEKVYACSPKKFIKLKNSGIKPPVKEDFITVGNTVGVYNGKR